MVVLMWLLSLMLIVWVLNRQTQILLIKTLMNSNLLINKRRKNIPLVSNSEIHKQPSTDTSPLALNTLIVSPIIESSFFFETQTLRKY